MKKKTKREFLILVMLCALSACTSAVEEDRSLEADRDAGTTKVAVHDSNKQDVGSLTQINVVLNWFEELKRLVPTP